MSVIRVAGIDGSPTGGGRTRTALAAVLQGAAAAGAETRVLALSNGAGEAGVEAALGAIADADAFVFASPVYRASFATPLKAFLDRLPRGMWDETEEPIRARAVAILLTGASWHHYLALNELRNVLAGFFAAHVLTPGLYVPASGFTEDKQGLIAPFDELAHGQGTALVALATAIAGSPVLAAIRPQA